MKLIVKLLLVGGLVTGGTISVATPANACIPDDPNCVARVICVGADLVNTATNKLGYGEPIPCEW